MVRDNSAARSVEEDSLVKITKEQLVGVRAVFFDIDGTLVNSDHQFTPGIEERLTILRSRGFRICLASGRPSFAAKPIIDALKIHDPCVFFSGGAIVQPSDLSLIESKPLGSDTVLSAIRHGEAQGWHTELYSAKEYAIAEDSDLAVIHREYLHHEPTITPLSEFGKQHEILKVVFAVPESFGEKEQEDLKRRFPDASLGIGYGAAHPWISFVNFTSREASRETAFSSMLDLLEVSQAETAAFGDGESDIPFLKLAQVGVAMENASREVKAAADHVCGHVDREGIVPVLDLLVAASG